MKKIFISALALAVGACGFIERDSSSYWLNQVRNYATYPVYYYTTDEFGLSEKLTGTKDIATHTYKRNVEVSANIGQRMVDSASFKERKFIKNKIVASNDGFISNLMDDIYIKKGQEFFPLGEVKIDGKYYMLIDADGNGRILLVDERGHLLNSISTIYGKDLLLSKNYATVTPGDLTIKQTDTERMDISDIKENFEIIFEGLNNGIFELTYVDYSNSDDGEAERYAYAQGARFIDVKGVKMEITGVYPDRIEYKLLY